MGLGKLSRNLQGHQTWLMLIVQELIELEFKIFTTVLI